MACGVGGLAVYVIDALVLAVALSDVAAPMTTFTGVLIGFTPVQVPLSVLEAVASVGIIRMLATRRPDLLPEPLRGLRKMPVSISSTAILLLAIGLSGCSYEGIRRDGSWFCRRIGWTSTDRQHSRSKSGRTRSGDDHHHTFRAGIHGRPKLGAALSRRSRCTSTLSIRFFERRQQLWRPALAFGTTLLVLILNVGADQTIVSLTGSGVAMLLLLNAYVRGHQRMEPALAWTVVLIASVVLCGFMLGGDPNLLTKAAARISCGVLWILWLGTQLDWASLRQLLLRARLPEGVVGTLDHAVMNAFLTKTEWTRRRMPLVCDWEVHTYRWALGLSYWVKVP